MKIQVSGPQDKKTMGATSNPASLASGSPLMKIPSPLYGRAMVIIIQIFNCIPAETKQSLFCLIANGYGYDSKGGVYTSNGVKYLRIESMSLNSGV